MRETFPTLPINELSELPTLFVNGRVLADDSLSALLKTPPKNPLVYTQDGSVVAAWVDVKFLSDHAKRFSNQCVSAELFHGLPTEEVEMTLFRYPWEMVHATGEAIVSDFAHIAKRIRGKKIQGKVYPGVHIVNKTKVVIGKGAVVKPGVVLDAEQGPIIISDDAVVGANAVIEGPAFVGRASVIKAGAKIHGGTSIGPVCKVGGEVEASIIQSFSNKQHDGFLGHSYLGSWVNIGADTNTSDLKNTYGSIQVTLNGKQLDTGLQFVGLFMGDHSKTGINVMFDTGSVVGVSCNVYGAGLPPKYLPPFSWGNAGGKFSTYRLDQSVETARRVMARRNMRMTPGYERVYRTLFEQTLAERQAAGIL